MPAMTFPLHPEQSPRLGSLEGLRVREDTLYTDPKGEESKGVRKRAEKGIEKLQEILKRVLEPEEAILYVARCQAPLGKLGQFGLGWYAYYISTAVLVFTNLRVLHFVVKNNGDWKKSLRSARWGDIEDAKVKGWLSLTLELKFRDGKKETFWKLRRDDAKKIKIILSAISSAGAGAGSSAQTIASLCPGCLAPLTPQVYHCAKCGITFKDEETMVRRAWLIPGGGCFYVGYRFLGVVALIAELYLLALVVIMVLVALGMPDPLVEPGKPPTTGVEAWILAAFFAGILAFEKWVTIHHCRRAVREFIPMS